MVSEVHPQWLVQRFYTMIPNVMAEGSKEKDCSPHESHKAEGGRGREWLPSKIQSLLPTSSQQVLPHYTMLVKLAPSDQSPPKSAPVRGQGFHLRHYAYKAQGTRDAVLPSCHADIQSSFPAQVVILVCTVETVMPCSIPVTV